MLILVAIAVVGLMLPLALRAARIALMLYAGAVVLFLPAGLLLRLGPGRDLRVYFAVSAAWGLVLVTAIARRRRPGAPLPGSPVRAVSRPPGASGTPVAR